MRRECIVIKTESNIPLLVVGVQSVEPSDFVKLQKEARENLDVFLQTQKATIRELQDQIDELKKEVKILKGEDESL